MFERSKQCLLEPLKSALLFGSIPMFVFVEVTINFMYFSLAFMCAPGRDGK